MEGLPAQETLYKRVVFLTISLASPFDGLSTELIVLPSCVEGMERRLMQEIRIRVLRHHKTGLLMALSGDLPGFVVHAHSHDELSEKLQSACEAFMRALGREGQVVVVVPEDAPPGFEANNFIAQIRAAA
jgi:hypothetical protein